MRKLYIFGLIGLAALIIGLAFADQITFTTYYPAPYGVYNDMVVMNTLGVGTTEPEAKLDVEGGAIKVRRDEVGPTRGAPLAKFIFTNNESDESDYDEEMVLSFGNEGDDRSTIFIGPNSYSGGKGRVELDCKTVHIENANVGIGTMEPEATLEVKGTMKVFGSWEEKQNNINYQAPTDGFVCAFNSAPGSVKGYTDGNPGAGTPRIMSSDTDPDGECGITMPVKKGHYWKVVGAQTVYWIPFGT